jgi:hypothetical protein
MGTQMILPQAFEASLAELDEHLSRQGSRSRTLAPASRIGYVRDCRRVVVRAARRLVAVTRRGFSAGVFRLRFAAGLRRGRSSSPSSPRFHSAFALRN